MTTENYKIRGHFYLKFIGAKFNRKIQKSENEWKGQIQDQHLFEI